MPKVTQDSARDGYSEKNAKTLSFFDQAIPIEKMPETGYKFLLFGKSGSGKSTLAADFPKPLLFVRPLRSEDGSRSVRTIPGVHPTPFMTDPDQLVEVWEGQHKTRRYKTIVIDGIDDLQMLCVKKHMGFQDVPVQLTYGTVPQADWNRIGITMLEYLVELMSLANDGTHVVLVCQEKTFGTKEDAGQTVSEIVQPKVMAALIPSMAGKVHKICDYNVHTFTRIQKVNDEYTGKVEFCIHLGAGTVYETKFRCPDTYEIPQTVVMPRGNPGSKFAILEKLICGESLKNLTPVAKKT